MTTPGTGSQMCDIMVRDILACYHFLNLLLLVLIAMIVLLFDTDIVPPGFYRRFDLSNRKLNVDEYYFPNIYERLPKNSQLKSAVHTNRQTITYVRENDTLFPYLAPERREQYGGFQNVGGKPGVFVYSATYVPNVSLPTVNVVVISTANQSDVNFSCTFILTNGITFRVNGLFKFIPEPIWNYTHRSAIICCPLPDRKTRPKILHLSSPDTTTSLNKLHIRYPRNRKNNLTRCYPAFHSTFNDTASLIWNIEISRLQGVDKFIFYNYDTNTTVSRILLEYQNEGLVEVRNWYLPIDYEGIHYWGQLAALHDCHFSQIGNARFELLADIDELVIPRSTTSLITLAQSLLFDAKYITKYYGALVFRNVFFPLILPETKTSFPEKPTALRLKIAPLLHTIRSRVHKAYDRSKVLVIPEAVEFLSIHSVEKFRGDWIAKVVDMDVALLHHYRRAPSLDMRPPWDDDSVVISYSSDIVSAVAGRYSMLQKAGVDLM